MEPQPPQRSRKEPRRYTTRLRTRESFQALRYQPIQAEACRIPTDRTEHRISGLRTGPQQTP